jgi:xylan 1,4-beta-xylosidase
LAREQLGFEAIRGHGVFDDDMSVLPSVGQYEWLNVNSVFDFLVSIGMKPVVELSFMPSALVKCGLERGYAKPCFYAFGSGSAGPGSYKGLTMPPNDFNQWYDLVTAFAKNLVSRYGIQEVSTWNFEVWNEMWGVDFPHPYMELYNASAIALKNVDSSLRVGGPATMQTLDVAEFVKATQAQKLPMDFVSTHFYPTDPQCQQGPSAKDPDCFANALLAARAAVTQNVGANIPLYITEYNDGLGGNLRDIPAAAAFVFRNVGLLSQLDMFSWWTFSDVFEEGWMVGKAFRDDAGYGMMTTDGIPKPVWRAFQLLKDAGGLRLPVKGNVSPNVANSSVSVLATLSPPSSSGLGLQLFVANFSRLDQVSWYSCDSAKKQCVQNDHGSYTDKALCDAQCQGQQSTKVTGSVITVTVTHAASASVPKIAFATRVDDDNANPYRVWQQSMGSPSYLTPLQIAQLKALSQPVVESIPVTTISATQFSLSFDLPPFAIVHITI